MNMQNFYKGMEVKTNATGVNIVDPNNNKIIHEAIVLEKLGGDESKLLKFYDNLGAYGARDGVLNESAALDVKLNMVNKKNIAKTTALLAVANESACEDYEMYTKAMLLMEAAYEAMELKYGEAADARLIEQEKELMKNARVVDALSKVK